LFIGGGSWTSSLALFSSHCCEGKVDEKRGKERKKGQANQDDMSLLNSLISLKAEIDQSTRRSVERKRSTNSFQTLLSAVVIDVNKEVVSRGGRKER
jgi:hypothetical protein